MERRQRLHPHQPLALIDSVVTLTAVIVGSQLLGISARSSLSRWSSSAGPSTTRWRSLSAIGALLALPGYPFWSLAIFAVDILIIYGLAAYGGRARA